MKIRKAKKEDLKDINRIYIEATIDEVKIQFPKRSKQSVIKELEKWEKVRLKDFRKEIDAENNIWLVVEVNGKVIGFANADINKKKEGRFTMLYLEKKFRGKGIGKKLTRKRLQWMKSKKAKKIEAGPYIKNKRSISNLKNFGFVPISIKMVKEFK